MGEIRRVSHIVGLKKGKEIEFCSFCLARTRKDKSMKEVIKFDVHVFFGLIFSQF